jgi:hypothetical protein
MCIWDFGLQEGILRSEATDLNTIVIPNGDFFSEAKETM